LPDPLALEPPFALFRPFSLLLAGFFGVAPFVVVFIA
jgi:hypothetical protein